MNITECLDERNRDFYNNFIKNKDKIKLITSEEDKIWRVKYLSENDPIEIYCGRNFPNVESFTHEILHVYLYQNGFNRIDISNYLRMSNISHFISNPKFIFSEIENLIAHYKMAPIFTGPLNMNIDKFYADDRRYVTDEIIAQFLSKKIFDKDYISDFLAIFFSCRYDMTKQHEEDYNGYCSSLKISHPILYSNLENICLEWESDITDFKNTIFFDKLINELSSICDQIFLDQINSY